LDDGLRDFGRRCCPAMRPQALVFIPSFGLKAPYEWMAEVISPLEIIKNTKSKDCLCRVVF